MFNVVIVDDHDSILAGVKSNVDGYQSSRVIATYNDPKVALSKIPESDVDLVITDYSMQTMTGDDFVAALKDKCPDLKVIVFTMHNNMIVIDRMMKAGVEGYVEKCMPLSELERAVEEVLRGGTYYTSGVHRYLNMMMRDSKGKNRYNITPREFDIIELISREYTTSQISQQLNISKSTVETYRNSLLKKFEVKNAVGLIRRAIQLGIVTVED